MAFAKVLTDVIVAAGDVLPVSDVVVGTGAVVADLRGATVTVQESCGWFAVPATVKPDDTSTTFFASRFEVQAGRPVEVWDEFPLTPKMIEARTRDAKFTQMVSDAESAAFDRLRQIRDYNRPDFTSAIAALNVIAGTAGTFSTAQTAAHIKTLATRLSAGLVEMERVEDAAADEAVYIAYLGRMFLGGAMLDAAKD